MTTGIIRVLFELPSSQGHDIKILDMGRTITIGRLF
jgi:hypothetical protein